MSNRDTEAKSAPYPYERHKWISVVLALLGVWLFAVAVLFDIATIQSTYAIIVGILLVIVGGYNYSRWDNNENGSESAVLIAIAASLWLILAPFLFSIPAGPTTSVRNFAFWNDIIVGLIALGLSTYSAYVARTQHRKEAHNGAR